MSPYDVPTRNIPVAGPGGVGLYLTLSSWLSTHEQIIMCVNVSKCTSFDRATSSYFSLVYHRRLFSDLVTVLLVFLFILIFFGGYFSVFLFVYFFPLLSLSF